MSSKRVAIISSRGIFRDGLKHLLAKVALVELVGSIEEVEDLMHKQQIDVVIIDRYVRIYLSQFGDKMACSTCI